MNPSSGSLDLVLAWCVVAFTLFASATVVRRAFATRSASNAHRVVGVGCATVVLGIVVTSMMLIEAFRRLAEIDDAEIKARVLTIWIERVSPPGYAALVIGLVVVCVGAWLRASAQLEDERRR
jgi:Na+/pantothenate symporter